MSPKYRAQLEPAMDHGQCTRASTVVFSVDQAERGQNTKSHIYHVTLLAVAGVRRCAHKHVTALVVKVCQAIQKIEGLLGNA
jgi:hypothetical protein